jgi:hypothetical protein
MRDQARSVYEKHAGTIGAETVKRMQDTLAQIRK